jgi:hypothetical protein
MSSSLPRRKVLYTLPLPSDPPPLLALPEPNVPRNCSPNPLLLRHPQPERQSHNARPYDSHPQHALSVTSLALDLATVVLPSFSSKDDHEPQPRGLLYSGGRDGLVISWDLGLGLKKRERRYGSGEEELDKKKRRVSSVWSLDLDEQTLDNVAGDASNQVTWESSWEISEEDGRPVSHVTGTLLGLLVILTCALFEAKTPRCHFQTEHPTAFGLDKRYCPLQSESDR